MGTANSFLKAADVTRTRQGHQITAATLNILQHKAYGKYTEDAQSDGHEPLEFGVWCQQRAECCLQFQYWATTLNLELIGSSPPEGHDKLSDKHPDVAAKFQAGHFTAKMTARRFSAMALDQALEQNNAYIKGDGGAVGLTGNPSALRRCMVAGPEVARVIAEFESSQKAEQTKANFHHHEQTNTTQDKFLQDVKALTLVMEEMGNPFEEESADLMVLHTKEILCPEAVKSVQNVVKLGQEQFLEDKSKPIGDTIKLNKLTLFSSMKSKAPTRSEQQLAFAKDDCGLFSRLYIACQTREGDLDEFFKHENRAYPPALSSNGKLRFIKKTDLLTPLEQLADKITDALHVTSIILDGPAVVEMLKPGGSRTFQEYSTAVYIPYIESQLEYRSRLDLVWECYLKSGRLKATVKCNRGKGIRRRVTASGPLPSNWQNFLRNSDNKEELFSFLSEQVMQLAVKESKQLVVTDKKQVLTVPPRKDTANLAPCNHEEGDTMMMVHAADALECGHRRTLIRTVDTDVVILAVGLANERSEVLDELWLTFGTGKNRRYIAAHQIAKALGPEKSRALPVFHAITVCDTVSAFADHSKKAAWATWNAFPEVTTAFLSLASTPSELPDGVLSTLERFIVLLYDRTSTCCDVNVLRKKLFSRKSRSLEHLPPARAALEQHIKRAAYQAGHIWGQASIAFVSLPSPCDWGWMKSGDELEPLWTTLSEVSKSCHELISCGCRKHCGGKCRCKKAALKCTGLCACEGGC
ncbi:hypothetical protein Hamer_G012740 [Homarus americanus]|uniref:Tesmin/TSO1-like CXC domain-containing protein n=1 Tax=Homarus americanus TaxID=6706 RepID=A0A8J5JQ11_HOMAM|nr:hypothetical protein Hamer_G012740 [Homarus americanus]